MRPRAACSKVLPAGSRAIAFLWCGEPRRAKCPGYCLAVHHRRQSFVQIGQEGANRSGQIGAKMSAASHQLRFKGALATSPTSGASAHKV
jgi:hypothetical protein